MKILKYKRKENQENKMKSEDYLQEGCPANIIQGSLSISKHVRNSLNVQIRNIEWH